MFTEHPHTEGDPRQAQTGAGAQALAAAEGLCTATLHPRPPTPRLGLAQSRMMPKIFTDAQLRDKDIDTLKRYLRYRLGGYRVALAYITTESLLYRGVPWPERPSAIDDLSYPPVDRVTKLGRVNRCGKPMFYCSAAGPGVFYELRAKAGDLIALSEWEIAEPLWMHNLGYHQDALRRLGASDVATRPRWNNPIPNETKHNARLRRQLSLAFTEDIRDGQEYRYKQSIAINELLFGDAEPLPKYPDGPRFNRAAGTVYPAMRLRGSADNIAMFPDFVDTSLRIRSVRYVLVEAADEGRSSYSFLIKAISHSFSGREIVWQDNLPSDERQRRSHIALQNGHWVLRDGFGDVYYDHPS
jgi:hypothetical protein